MSAGRRIPSDIEQHLFDVIVVGAGINGAGIARDAAMRGLNVLLLDMHDVGSGTTPWSTRLIHGGLRYLEHAEIGLVRESLRERETLLRIAPHLVKPLRLLLPIYDWHRRGPTTIRLGMLAYDLLSARKSLPRHEMLSTREALAIAPDLARDGLRGAASYSDAQVAFPERLTLENVRDAATHGATVITHAEVERVVVHDKAVTGVEVRCRLDDHRFRARASTIINATGPWVDRLVTDLEPAELIGGTKGSHIVVNRMDDVDDRAVYSEAKEDGRPFFIIPWREWTLIGTTDVPFVGDPGEARPTHEEVEYLIRQTRAIFPSVRLNHEHVLFAYAGVRPLPAATGKTPGTVTRRHFVRHHAREASGFFTVIGGKLTTYRSLAEEVTDLVCQRVGHGDRCMTAVRPLPGYGDATAAEQRLRAKGVPPATIQRLSTIYGSRITEVHELIAREPTLSSPIGSDRSTIAAEVVFAVEREFATTMADILLRRTMLGLRPGLGLDTLEPALRIAKRHLGWSTERIDVERQRYLREVDRLRVT